MTGLERIIEQIKADSEQSTAQIIENAQAEADGILEEAMNATEAECRELLAKGKEDAKVIDRIANSSAQQQLRRATLGAQREVIEGVFAAALTKLRTLPDNDYFLVLHRLASKNAEYGEGEILLSEEDKKRLPADFLQKLNEKLTGKGSLTIAKDCAATNGGLILRYGGIEINCTFEALIEGKREQLSDKLNKYIFG